MSPLQTDSRSSASTSSETQTQKSLREVHERLVSFIAAHTNLGKATLSLADSIVEFYSPQVGVGVWRYTSSCDISDKVMRCIYSDPGINEARRGVVYVVMSFLLHTGV